MLFLICKKSFPPSCFCKKSFVFFKASPLLLLFCPPKGEGGKEKVKAFKKRRSLFLEASPFTFPIPLQSNPLLRSLSPCKATPFYVPPFPCPPSKKPLGFFLQSKGVALQGGFFEGEGGTLLLYLLCFPPLHLKVSSKGGTK